jgi:hypothetical protein
MGNEDGNPVSHKILALKPYYKCRVSDARTPVGGILPLIAKRGPEQLAARRVLSLTCEAKKRLK